MSTAESDRNVWIGDMLEAPQAPVVTLVWSQSEQDVVRTFASEWEQPELRVVHDSVRFARLRLYLSTLLSGMPG
jgi:hypothetical protein